MQEKNLFIIAGCNGAGKTTASFNILPDILNCKEFVNADEIARGLSPFRPESVSVEAGRLMLERIDELMVANCDFAFERTLASRSFVHTIREAKAKGYFVSLLFFFLESTDLAISRVKNRVLEGGHYIPNDIICRRYVAGIKNLFNLYFTEVDSLLIFDNSNTESILVAEKEIDGNLKISNQELYNKIQLVSHEL